MWLADGTDFMQLVHVVVAVVRDEQSHRELRLRKNFGDAVREFLYALARAAIRLCQAGEWTLALLRS